MPETYVYKETPDCSIHLDIYAPPSASKPFRTIMWVHGGAMIVGSRGYDERFIDEYVTRGYAFVSIDYRLAPETKLPEIVSDVRDALIWTREEG